VRPLPIAADEASTTSGRTNLKDLLREELRAFIAREGEPAYRGDQLFGWIYKARATTFEAMTDLPKRLRERLPAVASLDAPAVAAAPRSVDGTEKLLLRLADGLAIESVLIPDEDRTTLCVSTQVGCALACRFCATGDMGFTRNLATHEVVDQFLIADGRARAGGRHVTNVVLMGMGEPLLNPEATAKALKILSDPKGVGLSPHRITLSTVGILPRMVPFIEETGVQLAVSLHAPTEELRGELMPIERKYPLSDLLATLRENAERLRGKVTFEYALLGDVNDAPEQARELARRLRGIPAKVNLIPFNPHAGSPYRRPSDERIDRFRRELLACGTDAYVRRSRGLDIAAACGQLALVEGAAPPAVGERTTGEG
jgi:23S rRNA (adenine2503-C2)-methyltransferase